MSGPSFRSVVNASGDMFIDPIGIIDELKYTPVPDRLDTGLDRKKNMYDVLIALACLLEDGTHLSHLANPAEYWFWWMCDSASIRNPQSVSRAVIRAANRDYDTEGYGGFIYAPGVRDDMRQLSLVQQVNRWITSHVLMMG